MLSGKTFFVDKLLLQIIFMKFYKNYKGCINQQFLLHLVLFLNSIGNFLTNMDNKLL